MTEMPAGGMEGVRLRGDAILRRLPVGPCSIVEVGVYRGQLGEYLLDRRRDLHWTGVDPWAPADQQPREYVASGDPHAVLAEGIMVALYMETCRRMRRFGERAMIVRAPSVSTPERIAFEPLAMVFLDGDHSLAGVRADIRTWWPLVQPGGWLAGHDWAHPNPAFDLGVDQAVTEFVEARGLGIELDDNMTWFVRKPEV